jgi:hypothetical protein
MQDRSKLLIDRPQQSGSDEMNITQSLNQQIVMVIDSDRLGASYVHLATDATIAAGGAGPVGRLVRAAFVEESTGRVGIHARAAADATAVEQGHPLAGRDMGQVSQTNCPCTSSQIRTQR